MRVYIVYYEPTSDNMAAFTTYELAERYVREVVSDDMREYCYIDDLKLWEAFPTL